jgi:hypothetical protein
MADDKDPAELALRALEAMYGFVRYRLQGQQDDGIFRVMTQAREALAANYITVPEHR